MFVEVKARDSRAFGDAAEAVTRCKRRRMAQLALDYMTRHHLVELSLPLRRRVDPFRRRAEPMIEVFQNAFDAFMSREPTLCKLPTSA